MVKYEQNFTHLIRLAELYKLLLLIRRLLLLLTGHYSHEALDSVVLRLTAHYGYGVLDNPVGGRKQVG